MSAAAPTLNKRRVPRREVSARIGLLHKGQYHLANAHEIGEGGLLVSCESLKLRKGDLVVVTLRIPGVIQGVVLGSIIYVTPEGRYGMSFDKIEFELKRQIRNFVASSTTGKTQASGTHGF